MTKKQIGRMLYMARANAGLSQSYVAKRIKVTQGQYSKLESGKADITLRQFLAFATISARQRGKR